jgi:hypothetical protein
MHTLLIRAVGQEQDGLTVMNLSLICGVLSVNRELFQCIFEFRSFQIKSVA